MQNNALSDLFPWRRLWARLTDYAISITLGFFWVGAIDRFVSPELGYILSNDFMFIIVTTGVWVFAEAFMLSRWSTTCGKWLCGIRVHDANGQALTFKIALARAAHAWVNGFGFGLVPLNILAMIHSYRQLTRTGQTSWDRKYNTTLTIEPITKLKMAFFAFIIAIPFLMLGYAQLKQHGYIASEKQHTDPETLKIIYLHLLKEWNKELPKMIDPDIRLDEIGMDNNVVVYKYTFIQRLKTENDAIRQYQKQITPDIKNEVRTSPEFKIPKELGATIIYDLRDKNKETMFKITVTPGDYRTSP